MLFSGHAAKLTAGDIERAATAIGCQVAAVRAVTEVESKGGGFLPDGRPKILFEAHVFSRLTGHRFDQVAPAVSSPRWERGLYKGGAGEYPRLEEAMRLDETAALMSASWGMFQILGANHRACGFLTVGEFVAAMVESEGRQLDAFAAFVKSNARMWDAIINLDWPAFARQYNGPGYAENRYDVRLAEAFSKSTVEA